MPAGNLHEALKPLAWLAGRWRSISADGFFPTIQPFKYCEEVTFECVGQPILNYHSKTWHPEKGNPMHLESGFLRINPGTDRVAFMIAHNFGLASLEEGNVGDKQLRIKSSEISRMCFAKDPAVLSIERCFWINDEGQLELEVSMETTKTPLTPHLKAKYERCDV